MYTGVGRPPTLSTTLVMLYTRWKVSALQWPWTEDFLAERVQEMVWKYLDMRRVVRKPAFCICEKKGAVYFRYMDSAFPLLPKSKISSL